MDENQAPEANNPAPVQAVVDLNSVFYMHPSESAGSAIIPVIFDGSGYRSWRRGVLRALSVKNKTGFINGKVDKPSPNSALLTQWERCADMVTSWILNSLSKDIGDSLQYVNNARELWVELEDRYDQPNGAKLYQLQREINDLSQGNLDVTGYYTQLKRLWEKLSTLDTSCQCTCLCICGGKVKMHKAEQDRRLIQFLMGLNEAFTIVRGSILMMNPLPTMAQAFSILVQEERQREVKPYNKFNMESTSLHVNAASTSTNFRTNYVSSYKNDGGNRPPNRSNLFCDYCRKPGHTRNKCYKLHGFPPDFKFTKGKNAGTTAIARGYPEDTMNKEKGPVESAQGSVYKRQGQLLTRQQFDQLMHLLQHVQIQEDSNTTTGIVNDNTGGAVNFADSGATHHMTFNKSLLTNIRHLPYPFLITLPNGYKVKVTEIGDVCLNPSLTLWKGPSLKSPLEIGRARNGLYFLYSKCHISCPDHTSTTLRNATSMPSSSSSLTSLSVHPISSCKSSCNLMNFSSDTHKAKFDPRSTPHIFIGYPFNKKGYKVLDICTKKMHVSRDVVFYENVFPFASCDSESPESDTSFSTILKKFTSASNALSSTNNYNNIFDNSDVLDDSTTSNVILPEPASPPAPVSPPETLPTDQPSNEQLSRTLILPKTTTHQNQLSNTRKSSRPHVVPAYLKEYDYSLPSSTHHSSPTNHYSLTSFN
ncbi:uncharacterized protein LOC125839700 [Solanum verrucosum]|uniref:uncharacterized protein LOC125839700 n=1 Tax=Solanum verrucosum TaxID=315347 RepID=UPI0020D11EA7|nr:uncharacterized protein LOC125839700 [Solanum verrucosum]